MSVTLRAYGVLTALFAAMVFTASHAHATAVSGWQWDGFSPTSAPAAGLINNAGTSSPVIGDGTDKSAANLSIYASMPDLTLAAPGDTIALNFDMTIVGLGAAENPPTGSLRLGLYDDQTLADDNLGWAGYQIRNVLANSTANLRGSPALTTSAAGSNGQNVNFGSALGAGAGEKIQSATYHVNMTIGMDGSNNLLVSSSIISSDQTNFPYTLIYPTQTLTPPGGGATPVVTYAFNRVYMQSATSGSSWTPDQITYANVDVTLTAVPEPATCTLAGLGLVGLFAFGLKRRKR